ncbi:hypothetical protein BGW37DRAFT_36307 [Umbelopsis sp. PMI_123]|nr:hypothetical protein BGW37DRAFT_36307 [Umbelopsis sp. PMI_123]
MLFFPRPPRKPLCKPPNKGGINLIDTKPQHEALQIIHIQRTCMKSATTFLRSIFQYLVNFYTGQPEVISSMMNAKTPKAMLKDHAQLNNIWQLLITFPKIRITKEWKKHFLHVPVIEAVVPADPTVVETKTSIRYLVVDFYDWHRLAKRLEAYSDNIHN